MVTPGPAPHFEPTAPAVGQAAKLKGFEKLIAKAWKEGRLEVSWGARSKLVHRMRSFMDKLMGKPKALDAFTGRSEEKETTDASDSGETLEDLFGDDSGDEEAEGEADVTTNFESITAAIAPTWLAGQTLTLRLGDRVVVVHGGQAKTAAVLEALVLSRLRGWLGVVGAPVDKPQQVTARAILDYTGLTKSKEPLALACREALSRLKKEKIPLKAPGEASNLVASCGVQSPQPQVTD